MAPRETWFSENFGRIYQKCFGEDQVSKFLFPCFFLSQLSFQFFSVRISESWLSRVGFQNLLRTQVTYIKLCEENIIKTGCVTTYMYVTVSLLLCPAYSFVQFFLLSLAASRIWLWHSKLKGLIRLRFSHIVEVFGLGYSNKGLMASLCLSLWFYHSSHQRMLLFSGLPHRIYISKIKWVEPKNACLLTIELARVFTRKGAAHFLLFQSNGILWNTQRPEK